MTRNIGFGALRPGLDVNFIDGALRAEHRQVHHHRYSGERDAAQTLFTHLHDPTSLLVESSWHTGRRTECKRASTAKLFGAPPPRRRLNPVFTLRVLDC